MTTSVFLPDFVGYPLCYLGIRTQLPDDAPAIFVDYNNHWPYPSVPALAGAIARGLVAPEIGAIVGYSFGAHVALLLADALVPAGATPEFVLIDPPAIGSLPPRDPAAIEALLRSRPEYAYIFDVVACGLTSLDCMIANIELLGRLTGPRPVRAPGALFVAGGPGVAREVLAELDGPAGALELVCLEGCDHRSILGHQVVVDRLGALARGQPRGGMSIRGSTRDTLQDCRSLRV